MSVDPTTNKSRWYHGGVASSMAACVTHPLDLLKVHLQTGSHGEKVGLFQVGARVVKTNGWLGLYNGISASLLRQMTYSTTRFAIYEGVKNKWMTKDTPFYEKALVGGFSGFVGGIVGTPGDVINVRMQNDVKLPLDQRRNYKNALDGLYQVTRHEGPLKLMSGVSMASSRAIAMAIGQLVMYDVFKDALMTTDYFKDNIQTHFTASCLAAGTATLLTMPLDVLKTRMMNAAPGQYDGILDCFKETAALGPSAFFKGFVPAFVRLGPQTVLMFLFMEQLRLNFGYQVKPAAHSKDDH